ncbi:hypothetical protein F5Y07DRAFT_369817 [Xylaria sp. FL0933]|nr:hypothetical protein F5Y07DRAFT_369817 [Xylaria sp. FL0933]
MSDAGQGISPGGFLAVIWVLTGLATVLFFGRLLVRSILLKSFHTDDVFSALAWFFMTVAIILATVALPLNYKSSSIVVGETPTPPAAELADITITLRKWDIACETFFWTGLYCVKLSFVFLYRLVFGNHRQYRLVWTLVTVYIVLSYGICLIGVYGQCGSARYLFSYAQCMTPYVTALDLKLVWVDYVFNLTSDLALFIFPLPIIWGLTMHVKQKLAVTAICSLALITIAFDTVRTVKLSTENMTLTNIYAYLELTIAVLISMLPSYRFLVSPSDKDREYRRLFWTRITLRSNRSYSSQYSMHNVSRGQTSQSEQAINESTLEDEPAPPVPTAIRVKTTIDVA